MREVIEIGQAVQQRHARGASLRAASRREAARALRTPRRHVALGYGFTLLARLVLALKRVGALLDELDEFACAGHAWRG